MLKHHGFKKAVAHSGPEALAAARQFQPQVILCDLGLPGMPREKVLATVVRLLDTEWGPYHEHYYQMQDPEGNEFCLI